MKEITDFDLCPHCGANTGYYTKDYIYGTAYWNCNFDGSEADNSEKMDYLMNREGKQAYCQECDKYIAKINH